MNIIVVSQYYYPDNFKINDIVNELVSQGHTVKVITGLPDYTTSKIPKEFRFFKKRNETVFGAKTIRVPTIARRSGIIFRALNYLSFVVSGYLYASFCKKENADAVFVYETSPIFQAIPAIKLSKRFKTKLVLYCCDLWPESLKAWNIKETSLIYKVVRKISAKLYNACDTVAITSEPFKKYLEDVCSVSSDKICYLPQHAEDLFGDIKFKYVDNRRIDFLFAGNIGSVQNVDCIIKAIPYVQNDNYLIHIVGDGSEFEACKHMAETLNTLDHIVFHGRYPVEEMKEFYLMADCFLLTLRGSDFIGMTLPSKAQSYLCSGKPIVAAINGAGQQIVNESGCGKCVKAGDYIGLASLIDNVIENFDSYKIMGKNGRKYYEQNFTKDIYINNLLNILND